MVGLLESQDKLRERMLNLPQFLGEKTAHKSSRACYFSVVTWGRTATMWLSQVLRALQGVYCTHGTYGVLRFHSKKVIELSEYFNLLTIMGKNCELIGDVHGIDLYELPECQSILGDRFRAVAVTRHPIDRLISACAFGVRTDHSSLEKGAKKWLEDNHFYFDSPTTEDLFFAKNVLLLNRIVDEVERLPVYRMEDLVTCGKHFQEMLDYLSQGSAQCTPEYIKYILTWVPVNQHGRSFSISESQKIVLRQHVKPEAWDAYRKLGYMLPKWI